MTGFTGHERLGEKRDGSLTLSLEVFLRYLSFETLPAVNKSIIGSVAPYIGELRGHEGLGHARIISGYGPALLSSIVGRIYVTEGKDRLSTGHGFMKQMPLLAKGHFLMVREFGRYIGKRQCFFSLIKSAIYFVMGKCYQLLEYFGFF